MDITLQRIKYKDLTNQILDSFDDKYCMISDYLTPAVISTLLSNPNLVDKTKSALNLVICEGTVAGRYMLMPTKIKANDKVVTVQTGGSLEVAEQLRGRGLGTVALKESILNSEYNGHIGQLYSTTAIAIVKKLGLIVFELPSFYRLCNSRSFLESKGLSGIALKAGKGIVNLALRLMDIPNIYRLKKLKQRYVINKENNVPNWVNEITLNDGHAFMEVHDSKWLQWCLDNRFTDVPEDRQSFYTVCDKKGTPKGFFMTKLRFERSQGIYKNLTRGTIVEWGSYDEKELSEVDLNLLAIDSFEAKVDNITTVLSNLSLEQNLKKLGFIRHGNYQMTVRSGNLNQDGISDQSNWRIRYGGCNTIVF